MLSTSRVQLIPLENIYTQQLFCPSICLAVQLAVFQVNSMCIKDTKLVVLLIPRVQSIPLKIELQFHLEIPLRSQTFLIFTVQVVWLFS